jgi:putative methyltransferase (TIGR04325 family)
MNSALSHALRRWLPPVLSERLSARPRPSGPWRGVYPLLRDVPTIDGVFDSRLIGTMLAETRAALDAVKEGRLPYTWHEPLALLASCSARQRGRVGVVDFGGGTGTGFVQLAASLPDDTVIDYLVVDQAPVCAAGRALFEGDARIRFATELPPAAGAMDIVYANSVLQYIDDYAGALRGLAALGAPWLLLGQLAAGEFRTFATQQVNVPGQILPYWFLSVEEVTTVLKDSGYELVCQTLMSTSYDVGALPPELRADRMRNMLFRRQPHA